MKIFKNFRKSKKGSVIFESAIILSVFLLLVFGIFDLLASFSVASSLDKAVHSGGRHLAVKRNYTDLQTDIKEYLLPFSRDCISDIDMRIYTDLDGVDFQDNSFGTLMTSVPANAIAARLDVACSWDFITPVMRPFQPNGFNFKRSVIVVFE